MADPRAAEEAPAAADMMSSAAAASDEAADDDADDDAQSVLARPLPPFFREEGCALGVDNHYLVIEEKKRLGLIPLDLRRQFLVFLSISRAPEFIADILNLSVHV